MIFVESSDVEEAPDARPVSLTIPALIDEVAGRYGPSEAIVHDAVRLTYSGLRDEVRRTAKGFLALGVGHGSRVAILMGNRPEWIIAALAACSVGAVMVAVNTWLTAREFRYVLEHSDADTLVFAPRFLRSDFGAMLDEIRAEADALPRLRRIIHVDARPHHDSIAFDDLARIADGITDATYDAAAAKVAPDDVAYLLYTSGSTAAPKGVQLQHAGLIANMWWIGQRMHVVPRDRFWLAVSLFWGFGCENALFNALTHGGCLVLQAQFDAAEALRLIEAEHCTILYGTPNIVQMLHAHPDRAFRDLGSLRSGGSFGAPEQLRMAVELGATEICHIYGLTEAYGNCHVPDGRHDPPGKRFASVGRPLPGFVQRIADPQSLQVLGPGEVGEIQLKGHVTPGYYKDAARTAEVFTPDGFFRTGDLGMVDADGFLYYRGRLKELIKTGGINVSPAEIENVLSAHPEVQAAYVIGLPDPDRDEIIGAVIVSAQATEAELAELCRKTLAPYKLPRRYRFVSERDLPLTTTGKIQRNRLVDLFGGGSDNA